MDYFCHDCRKITYNGNLSNKTIVTCFFTIVVLSSNEKSRFRKIQKFHTLGTGYGITPNQSRHSIST
jgi:hypothetical protein